MKNIIKKSENKSTIKKNTFQFPQIGSVSVPIYFLKSHVVKLMSRTSCR